MSDQFIGCYIRNNVIYGNTSDGIRCGSMNRVDIHNGTIHNNGGDPNEAGIAVTQSDREAYWQALYLDEIKRSTPAVREHWRTLCERFPLVYVYLRRAFEVFDRGEVGDRGELNCFHNTLPGWWCPDCKRVV